jgi:SAM-dependent methyltransferase
VLVRCQGPGPHRVLDAAAGIGTQLFGLASRGHRLCGNDLSAGAISRARAESVLRGVPAAFTVADMRALPYADDSLDAVVCADNAVAHLESPHDLTAALAEMRRVVRPGGHVLVSTRDYEEARQVHPPGTAPQVSRNGGTTTVAFQVWDWHDDGIGYDLRHFQLTDDGAGWVVAERTSRLWAVSRRELADCARLAGLNDACWLLPDESRFFQPLLVAGVPDGPH